MFRVPASLSALFLSAAFVIADPPSDRGLVARFPAGPFGHAHEVHSVAFTPDGKSLLTAGYDHRARLWDLSSGSEARAFGDEYGRADPYGLARWVHATAVSPDGKLVATGLSARRRGAGTVELWVWDAATGRRLAGVAAGGAGASALAFTPDGKTLLAAGGDGTVGAWVVPGGKLAARGSLAFTSARAVGATADGKLAAVGDGTTVAYFDPATCQPVSHRDLPDRATALAFSVDGKTLALADSDEGKTIGLFDPLERKLVRRLTGHGAVIAGLSFSADGRHLASVDRAGKVCVWAVDRDRPLASLTGPAGEEDRAVAVSAGGRYVACADPTEQRARVWKVATKTEVRPIPGHAGAVRSVFVTPDATTVSTAGRDRSLRRWDAKTGKQVLAIAAGFAGENAAAVRPDGREAAWGGSDGRVHILNWRTGKELRAFKAHAGVVWAVAYSPNGKWLATAGADDRVRAWDPAAGTETMRRDTGAVPEAALRRDAPGHIIIWRVGAVAAKVLPLDPKGQTQEFAPPAGRGTVVSAAMSADGRVIAIGTSRESVHVFGPNLTVPPQTLAGMRGYVTAVAVSPDGRVVAAGTWGRTYLWELAIGQPRLVLDRQDGDGMALAFAANGWTLAVGVGDGSAAIYDLAARARRPAPAAGWRPADLDGALVGTRFEAAGQGVRGSRYPCGDRYGGNGPA